MDRRILNLDLRTAVRSLFDLAYPRRCLVCGRQLLACEDDICLCCRWDFPRTYFEMNSRNRMGDAFNALVVDCRYCFATALFYYTGDSGFRRITPSLKYDRNFGAGRRFARELAASLPEWMRDVDAVVPVPLHWTRHWSRGYNQAEVVAREVARVLAADFSGFGAGSGDAASFPGFGASAGSAGRPRCVDVLRRVRRTRSQAHTGVGGKSGNVRNAFRVRRSFVRRELALSGSGGSFRHILLIDDVFTTGATLAACHSALRGVYGPQTRISIATLAFVGNL